MDGEFIEKVKSFLDRTAFKGHFNKLDFSFLSENKKLVTFFIDSFSEDYLSKEELVLAEKLKKQHCFIESEDELDKILLQQYSCDVSGDSITDSEILRIKDKISEVNENINILKRSINLSKSQYNNVKSNVNCTKELLKEEKSTMSDVVAEYLSCNNNLNTALQNVNNEYNCYTNIFQKNFLQKNSVKNYLMLVPSPETSVEFSMAKKRVTRYINSCHNYSSIPVSLMNTTALKCNSSFCSTIPSNSDLTKLSVELSKIKESIVKNSLNKLLLEAEKKGLDCCLLFVKDLAAYEFMNLQDEYIIEKEDDYDIDIMEHLKQECMKLAECEITRVLIYLYESKITHRNVKLDVLDNFLKIVMRYSTIVDFLSVFFEVENTFFNNYNLYLFTVMKSLRDEFTRYLKCKDYMENIIRQPSVKPPPEMDITMKCLQFMLMPASGNTNDEIMNAVDELSKQVSASETNLLAFYETILQILNKKFNHCEALRTTVISKVPSEADLENNIKGIINNIKSVIDELDNKITHETFKCIVDQVP